MLRRVLGVVVGLVVAMVGIGLVEFAGQAAFPPPTGMDMQDAASIGAGVDRIPLALKLSVVVAWFAGTVAGGWAGLAVARWRAVPWIVAGVVVLGALISYLQIPHPLWMQAAGVLLPPLGAWIVLRLTGDAGARAL